MNNPEAAAPARVDASGLTVPTLTWGFRGHSRSKGTLFVLALSSTQLPILPQRPIANLKIYLKPKIGGLDLTALRYCTFTWGF